MFSWISTARRALERYRTTGITVRPLMNPSEQQVVQVQVKKPPLKLPWLQPEDLAPVAVFLASDAAARITGACYAVTGDADAMNLS